MNDEITTLKQKIESLQEQLEKQQKLTELGMLTAGIAHEVQNPLNFVINFSKMSARLIDDLSDIISDCVDQLNEDDAADIEDISADLKSNMQKIQEHGERAISIIRNILLQSRGKDGEFLPTDLASVVHEYVWLSYHAMRANDKSFNISIVEEYQENMPKVSTVTQDICRAVLNLMNNACYTVHERQQTGEADYTPTITVSVKVADGKAYIAVKDNGMGMDEATKAKLFNTIFTTKPVGKGTGLGLSIIHHIVHCVHHGEVLVDTAPGIGTTFTIVIPA